jgi:hypothetical protein
MSNVTNYLQPAEIAAYELRVWFRGRIIRFYLLDNSSETQRISTCGASYIKARPKTKVVADISY